MAALEELSVMTSNITKLFRELRKDGIKAVQRAACCRSCTPSEVQVFTTQQSDWRAPAGWSKEPSYYSTIYYDEVLAPRILLAAAKAGVAIEWDGDTARAMTIREAEYSA